MASGSTLVTDAVRKSYLIKNIRKTDSEWVVDDFSPNQSLIQERLSVVPAGSI